MYKGIKVIGRIENLVVILPENCLDEIAITLGLGEYEKLQHIVALCEKSGVHTKFIPDYNNIIPTRPYTEDLLGLPVINIRHVPLTNTFNSMVKRSIDIFGALVAIILFFTDHADFGNPGENNFERTADLQAGTCRTAQQAVLYV